MIREGLMRLLCAEESSASGGGNSLSREAYLQPLLLANIYFSGFLLSVRTIFALWLNTNTILAGEVVCPLLCRFENFVFVELVHTEAPWTRGDQGKYRV